MRASSLFNVILRPGVGGIYRFTIFIYTYMILIRFKDYVNEAFVGSVRGDIKKHSGKLKHKQLFDHAGKAYSLWWSEDGETCEKLARLYSGKFAMDLGGYAPSKNDVFLCTEATLDGDACEAAIVKTNGDDIVPDEVVIQAARLLRSKFVAKEQDSCTIFACGKDFVSARGSIKIDQINRTLVVFTPGNVKLL